MKKMSGVAVCIWDFDGTLFAPNPVLTKDLLESDYEVVERHTGWSKEKTKKEFHKIYKKQTPSATATAALLAGISVREAAIECEQYKDRRKYLSRDDRLIGLFHSLAGYRHFMLANGSKSKIILALEVLGVLASTFEEIVTAEIVGVTKPDYQGFQYIMHKTGFPAAAHLMIGDREAVDLVPAKELGMKTCLVWSEKKSEVSDVTLETVYEVADVLGK